MMDLGVLVNRNSGENDNGQIILLPLKFDTCVSQYGNLICMVNQKGELLILIYARARSFV